MVRAEAEARGRLAGVTNERLGDMARTDGDAAAASLRLARPILAPYKVEPV